MGLSKFVEEKVSLAKSPGRQRTMTKSIKNRKVKAVVHKLIDNLSDLNPFIYHVSTWGSVYIKFDDYPWSVRVADHDGRSRYNYKVNIHVEDCDKNYWLETDVFSKKRNHHFSNEVVCDAISFIRSKEP